MGDRETVREQRGVDDQARGLTDRGEAALDYSVANSERLITPISIVEMSRLGGGSDTIDDLLNMARSSLDVYERALGPESELASAQNLLQAFGLLEAIALDAKRASDGALLKPPPGPLYEGPPVEKPWLPSRPHTVDQIPPFCPGNVRRWRQSVADAEARAVAERLSRSRPKTKAPAKPDQQLQITDRRVGGGRSFLDTPFMLYYGNYGKVITLVKQKGMQFDTEDGRVAILAYIIRAVCGDLKEFKDYTQALGKNRDGTATAEELARGMLRSEFIGGETGGVMKVLFTAAESDLRLLTLLKENEEMRILIEASALKVIKQFTDISPAFIPVLKAPTSRCASIEWMHEIMREVPQEYKVAWAFRRIEADPGAYGRINPEGAFEVPIGHFIPVEDKQSKSRKCMLIGSAAGFTDTILIMTEEFRILQIDTRKRDLQVFCSAVLSMAPFVAMFYLVAAIGGIVILGQLLPAVLGEMLSLVPRLAARRMAPLQATAAMRWVDTLIACRRWEMVINAMAATGGVALDIHQAGGVTPYLKKLTNPVHAALLLLDLLTIKGALKADDLTRLIEKNRILGLELDRLYAEQKGLKALQAGEAGQEAKQLDDRALGEAAATADKSLPEAAGVQREAPASTVESGRPTLPDRATAPVQKELPRGSLEDARLWTKKPANDNKEIQSLADELAPRRAAKGAPKEGPHSSTPIEIPKREPIVELEPRAGGGPRPKPKKAQNTDELSPVADLGARKQRDAQRARQEQEAVAEPVAQEGAAEEAVSAASGQRARMGQKPTNAPATRGKGSTTSKPASSSREVRDALAVLENAAKADLEQRRFDRLLSLLRPFRKGGRKAAKAFRYDKTATSQAEKEMVDCPPELIEEVAIARATEELEIARRGDNFPESAFKSNFAAFEVTIDGKRFVLVARNEPKGMHSEDWIVQFLTQRVGPLSDPKNLARVKVHNVFTERAPCSGRCENVLKQWFKDANVFFVTGKPGQRSEEAAETIKRYWLGIQSSGQGGGLLAPVP